MIYVYIIDNSVVMLRLRSGRRHLKNNSNYHQIVYNFSMNRTGRSCSKIMTTKIVALEAPE